MASQYQVVGQCAHVRTMTQGGRMTLMLFKGALLPSDVPAEQIAHLLSVKLIKKVPAAGPELPGAAVPDTGAPVAPPVVPAPAVTEQSGGNTGGSEKPNDANSGAQPASNVKPFDDPERVAARAKLPEDGSLPHHAAGHPVWVEAAVAKGYAYEAAVATDKPELMALLRK